jgi:translation initiation factor IF-2
VPKNIRVYELAREMGMTNAEVLDLCVSLGIGVKSHSSGMVEAQADRARRKADREGLRREVQPEEAVEEKPAKAKAKATGAKATGAKAKATGAKAKATGAKAKATEAKPPEAQPAGTELAQDEPTGGGAAAATEAPVVAEPSQPVESVESVEPVESVESVEPAVAEPVPEPAAAAEAVPAVAEHEPTVAEEATPAVVEPEPEPVPEPVAPKRVFTSTGSSVPPRKVVEPEPAVAQPSIEPTPRDDGPTVPDLAARVVDPGAALVPPPGSTPPLSASGKPIPPPPVSSSGKPIPPPPGQGGRRAPAPTGPAPGRRTGPPPVGRRPPMGGGPRESVPGAGGGPGGGPGGRPGGGPGGRPGGGPGGGPGGRPGGGPGGRRPPRRRGRRRRRREELQPMDVPAYTPDDAAVPDGEVVLERSCTAQDLGPRLNRTAADVVRFLMQQGEMITATQSLSDDMIELFAAELGVEIRMVDPGEEQEVELLKLLDVVDDMDDDEAPIRPPIVTVMGHVDHGKTKLLDRIRNTNVVDEEAGGITQHIGAYQAEHDGRSLTFIDTPGHEAFTAMRARGADSTDIVVLVVAADDGVMPQTIEALNHARAAEVPIIVALNKIDRENADPQKVLSQLAEHDLVPEAWGGDTIVVEVSALQNLGVDDLLDNLNVVAEIEDLRADPDGRSQGVVLESFLDVGRGPVATVLVQRGTLKVGDPLVAGAAWGRVRALVNADGKQVKSAGPSMPVQVLGLSDVADAGEGFVVAPSEKIAGRVADKRGHWRRQANIGRDAHALSGGARLEDIFTQIQKGETATLNLIVKADVNGSLEAVTESLRKLERDDVKLAFVHRAVGRITENDIQLAATSNATIIGFNVRPERKARDLAVIENVEIRSYEIIYKLIEDIESAMLGLLAPEFEEVVTGDAEVREIFSVPRIGRIAGCHVTNGTITRGSKVRFLRDGTIIWKGEISSLRRFKEDVREVQSGFECGIGLSDYQDLKEGDVIETFEDREIPRT